MSTQAKVKLAALIIFLFALPWLFYYILLGA